jgi:hypothetical protein
LGSALVYVGQNRAENAQLIDQIAVFNE